MYIKVTCREAAQILVSGGNVWDGNDPWAGCVCELTELRRGKARRTRELKKWTRWCASHSNDWFIVRPNTMPEYYRRAMDPFDVGFDCE